MTSPFQQGGSCKGSLRLPGTWGGLRWPPVCPGIRYTWWVSCSVRPGGPLYRRLFSGCGLWRPDWTCWWMIMERKKSECSGVHLTFMTHISFITCALCWICLLGLVETLNCLGKLMNMTAPLKTHPLSYLHVITWQFHPTVTVNMPSCQEGDMSWNRIKSPVFWSDFWCPAYWFNPLVGIPFWTTSQTLTQKARQSP